VVMRDGRVAYDGPPLTHDQVHNPDLAMVHIDALAHDHHHPYDEPGRHDHAPHVASPLDARTAPAPEGDR
jgi:zinc transport system ATP-binding protein